MTALASHERADIMARYLAGWPLGRIGWPKATILRVVASAGIARRNGRLTEQTRVAIQLALALGDRPREIASRWAVSVQTVRRVRREHFGRTQ